MDASPEYIKTKDLVPQVRLKIVEDGVAAYFHRTAQVQQCRKRSARLMALQAETLATSEGYGLQAVNNCYVMNPDLAAEGCYSSRNHTFPQPVLPLGTFLRCA
jgi:sulfur transfer complex TusBCD TusB component (DsrH family)